MSARKNRPSCILIVEDNPGDVRLAREALKEVGQAYLVCVTTDGAEALAYLRRRGKHADALLPDLILLDLNVPRKDGRELLEEIKSDPNLRRIPVIIFTSSSAAQDILKAYELRANCYITKPTDLAEFFRAIKLIEEYWLTVVTLPPDMTTK